MKTTIRSIAITAFPTWAERQPAEGFFSVEIQFMDKDGVRIAKDVEVDRSELPRVLLAQRALMRREEG